MAINVGDTVYDMITQEEVQVLKVGDRVFLLSNGEIRETHEIWKTADAPPEKRGLFRRKK